ncbi:unnamed protein product [Scytosiphon promiscuus]
MLLASSSSSSGLMIKPSGGGDSASKSGRSDEGSVGEVITTTFASGRGGGCRSRVTSGVGFSGERGVLPRGEKTAGVLSAPFSAVGGAIAARRRTKGWRKVVAGVEAGSLY